MISKTIIFYFTGTGNNLFLAEELQTRLGNTDIFPISNLKINKVLDNSYDNIIFCVPSYYSHVPPFVKECLVGVKFTKEQKVITIVGCAGNRGYAVEDMRECVKKAGKDVSGEYMIILSGSYILSYSAFPNIYQRAVNYFAIKKINKIVNALKNNKLKLLAKPGIFYKEKSEIRL